MPFFLVAALLAGLGFALHDRAPSAARSVLGGDFFTGESGDVAINTDSQGVSQSSTAFQPAQLGALLGALPVSTFVQQPAPAPTELLTQEAQQPDDLPTFISSAPFPALCDVDVRNHPGYHVVCNGKQYS